MSQDRMPKVTSMSNQAVAQDYSGAGSSRTGATLFSPVQRGAKKNQAVQNTGRLLNVFGQTQKQPLALATASLPDAKYIQSPISKTPKASTGGNGATKRGNKQNTKLNYVSQNKIYTNIKDINSQKNSIIRDSNLGFDPPIVSQIQTLKTSTFKSKNKPTKGAKVTKKPSGTNVFNQSKSQKDLHLKSKMSKNIEKSSMKKKNLNVNNNMSSKQVDANFNNYKTIQAKNLLSPMATKRVPASQPVSGNNMEKKNKGLLVQKPGNSKQIEQKNLATDRNQANQSENQSLADSMRQKIDMKSKDLFDKNSGYLSSLDQQTQEYIKHFMQQQVEQTVQEQLQKINQQTQSNETQMRLYIQKQEEQFAKIMKLNENKSQSQIQELQNQIGHLQAELRDSSLEQGQPKNECSGINPTGLSFISDVSGLSIGNAFEMRKQGSQGANEIGKIDFAQAKQSYTEIHKAEKLSHQREGSEVSYNLNIQEFQLLNHLNPQNSSSTINKNSLSQNLQIIEEERRTPAEEKIYIKDEDKKAKKKHPNWNRFSGIEENFEISNDSKADISDRFISGIQGDEVQFYSDLNHAIKNQDDGEMIFQSAGNGQNQELIKERINRAKNQRNLQIQQSKLDQNPNLRSVDFNSNSSLQQSQRASFKSFNQTMRSGTGGMKSYLQHGKNQVLSPKSNYSGNPSNYSLRSGAFLEPTGSPEMGGRGALSHQAAKPGSGYGNMHSHFAITNRNTTSTLLKSTTQRNTKDNQQANTLSQQLFQSKSSKNRIGQTNDSREKSISSTGRAGQVNNYLQQYNINQNSQNNSQQNIDFDDVINLNAVETPNTQQTMRQGAIRDSLDAQELKRNGYVNVIDTESEQTNRREQNGQVRKEIFTESNTDSMTQIKVIKQQDLDSGDEFEVPDEDSNMKQVEKSLERITVTSLTQSAHGVQNKRMMMQSQMQFQSVKNLANSPAKTQMRGITSLDRQQKKFKEMVLSQARQQQTTSNIPSRKVNVNVKSFNLNGNHHQKLLEEQKNLTSQFNQQPGRYSQLNQPLKTNESRAKKMMTARDKNQELNLPGRSQTSLLNAFQIYMGQQMPLFNSKSPKTHRKELAAQPVSYTSLSNTSEHAFSQKPAISNNNHFQKQNHSQSKSNRASKPDQFSLANSVPMSSPRSPSDIVAISIKSDGGKRPNPFLTGQNAANRGLDDLKIHIDNQERNQSRGQPIDSLQSTLQHDGDGRAQLQPFDIMAQNMKSSLHQKASSLEKYNNKKLTLNLASDVEFMKSDANNRKNKFQPNQKGGQGYLDENLGAKTLPSALSNRGESIVPSINLELFQCTCMSTKARLGGFAASMQPLTKHDPLHTPFKSARLSDDDKSEYSNTYSNINIDQDDDDLGITQKVIHPVLKNPFKSRGFMRNDNISVSNSQQTPTTCGAYCKNLTPEQERTIILECLRKNIADYYYSEQNKEANGALNIHQQNMRGKAQPHKVVSDEIMAKFAKSDVSLNLMIAKENDKRYLMGAQWWREWCDYANFDLGQLVQANREFNQQFMQTNQEFATKTDFEQEKGFVDEVVAERNGLSNDTGKKNHNEQNDLYKKKRNSNKFSQGSSLSRNSNGIGIPLDSAKQREVDFKTELQNLKRQKSKEKHQQFLDGKASPSQSNSAYSHSRIASGYGASANNPFQAYPQVQKDMTTQSYYKRPGPVRNQPLLKDDGNAQLFNRKSSQKLSNNMYLFLKDDLIEHFDLEAVSMEVWQHFKAWYDCDFQLLRFIKQDRVNRNQLFLDLYPEQRMAAGGLGILAPTNNDRGQSNDAKLNTNRLTTRSGDCSALSSGRDIWLKSQTSAMANVNENGSAVPDTLINSPYSPSHTRASAMPASTRKSRPWGQSRGAGSKSAFAFQDKNKEIQEK